jgi:hypothetical protein
VALRFLREASQKGGLGHRESGGNTMMTITLNLQDCKDLFEVLERNLSFTAGLKAFAKRCPLTHDADRDAKSQAAFDRLFERYHEILCNELVRI